MILAQLTRWFKPSEQEVQAHALYLALVTQSRQPIFYTNFGVDDTVDGRFDLIALHVFLLSHALRDQEEEAIHDMVQQVVDRMFVDMDQSLREMGVGDVSIGKKAQKMAYALNGRMEVYGEHWEDKDALAKALWRNLYRSQDEAMPHASAMADYAYDAVKRLELLTLESLKAAQLPWPEMPAKAA